MQHPSNKFINFPDIKTISALHYFCKILAMGCSGSRDVQFDESPYLQPSPNDPFWMNEKVYKVSAYGKKFFFKTLMNELIDSRGG